MNDRSPFQQAVDESNAKIEELKSSPDPARRAFGLMMDSINNTLTSLINSTPDRGLQISYLIGSMEAAASLYASIMAAAPSHVHPKLDMLFDKCANEAMAEGGRMYDQIRRQTN